MDRANSGPSAPCLTTSSVSLPRALGNAVILTKHVVWVRPHHPRTSVLRASLYNEVGGASSRKRVSIGVATSDLMGAAPAISNLADYKTACSRRSDLEMSGTKPIFTLASRLVTAPKCTNLRGRDAASALIKRPFYLWGGLQSRS